MRQYKFRALVMLDPAAREDAVQCDRGGARACCVVEPGYCMYFPAMLSLEAAAPPQAKEHAVVTIALNDREAGAFFAPGQRFTIWSDAVIDHSIQAVGLAGYGVIFQCVSPRLRLLRGTAAGKAAPGKQRASVPSSR
jgi:hypothetical protein